MVREKKEAPKKTLVMPGDGDPCHRCGGLTQIREHKVITAKELARPFYYSRWFYCSNPDCVTNLIMPERYKVVAELQVGDDT